MMIDLPFITLLREAGNPPTITGYDTASTSRRNGTPLATISRKNLFYIGSERYSLSVSELM